MPARRLLTALLATLLALPGLIFAASPAQADLYRYWSFWQQEGGQWSFVEVAPTDIVPADGAVNGWRFGVGGVDGATTRPPRSTASFAEICGTEPAVTGQKKVAEIIDTGTVEDAPAGATVPEPVAVCATVAEDANAVQTLQAVADVRLDNGLLCGIFGYPATGCGDVVAGASALPSDNPTQFALPDEQTTEADSAPNAVPIALIAVTVLAVILAIVALLVSRRRRN
ncbi:MAG: hypothetical protein QG597_4817 [Actinomycetota bacterium]|nr:hypothetical protein [Actinomycetota bacterium]